MNSKRLCIAVAAWCAVCGWARAGDGLPGVEWDELTKAVRAIQRAGSTDEATAAYTKGCTVNRLDPRLQDAYMCRMLKFGRPDVAYHPAQELTKLDAKNGVAWGVIGYTQARRKQYLVAFVNCMKAADLARDNPSICHNAAQLLAWYGGAQRAPVRADTAELAKKFKSSSYSGQVFAEAYKKARASYAKLDQEKDVKKKEATAVEQEAKKLDAQVKKLKDDLRSRGKTYDSERRRLRQAEQSLSHAEDQIHRSRDYRSRQSAERRRDQLIRQIRDTRRSLSRHYSEGKKIRSQLDDLEKKQRSKRSQANRMLREADAVAEGMPSAFTWQPPAVDGVVTPDATVAKATPNSTGKTTPKTSYLAPSKPTKPPAPTVSLPQKLAEAEAGDKLSLAKICMDSTNAQMRAKAKQLLQDILANYSSTKAAGEAAELIKKLP
jgi:hypothetical protein